jgi:hypothetical protein
MLANNAVRTGMALKGERSPFVAVAGEPNRKGYHWLNRHPHEEALYIQKYNMLNV